MAAKRRPRLFDFNQERSEIVKDAAHRVIAAKTQQASKPGQPGLEYVLNEACFHEIDRLVKFGSDTKQGEVGSLGFWRKLAARAGSAGEGEKEHILNDLVFSYMTDLAGNFDPRVYQFANHVLPVGLSLLFNAQGSGKTGSGRYRKLRERVRIDGDLDTLRSLANKGTFIVAPTHVSNMDSIVVGWALHEAGLPPVTYGAGKNLFGNPLLSYFMQNLGAYKVDRRIRHNLYKECLKSYSEVLLERGFHSLFFPGGTRSRSGEVEEHLKLGLLGTGLTAYLNNCRNGRPDDRIFIVPVTINFGLCLEAEGLIGDHLRQVGREYYILPDDPFDSPTEVLRFLTRVAAMETSVVLRFGQPLDIIGNVVDADGQAYDSHGRRVETSEYFEVASGHIMPSGGRDREYTRQAGLALERAFVTNTVVMPAAFLSHLLMRAARRAFPDLDIARVVRFAHELHVPWDEINADAVVLQQLLVKLAANGGIQLLEPVARASVPELIEIALRDLAMYHAPAAAVPTGQGIRLQNMNVLCYYGNRLNCLNLDRLEAA